MRAASSGFASSAKLTSPGSAKFANAAKGRHASGWVGFAGWSGVAGLVSCHRFVRSRHFAGLRTMTFQSNQLIIQTVLIYQLFLVLNREKEKRGYNYNLLKL